MKRKAIILLSAIFASCALLVLGLFLNQQIKRIVTRRNLEEIITSRLPNLPEFEMIDMMSEDFESPDGSCFYSRDYYSLGSSVAEDVTIMTYLKNLEDLGWQYARLSTSSLEYGTNTSVSVFGWRSSNVFLRPLVPEEMITVYTSIIVVSVEYRSC